MAAMRGNKIIIVVTGLITVLTAWVLFDYALTFF